MEEGATQALTETEALVALVFEKLDAWLTGLIEMLPNLMVAIVVVVLAALVARLLSNLVERAAEKSAANAQVASLLAVATRLGILTLGMFVALGILQLEKTVTSLLAGVGVVGLALGFAFQDIASNFMSGIIMAIREPFQLGDLVETHGQMGHVERVTLRATILKNFSGQLVIIPNKDVLQSPITNYTQTRERRVEVEVGVAYDDDLEQALSVACEAVEEVPGRDASRDVDAIYTGFGASSVDMQVRFWLDLNDDKADYLKARSHAVVAIREAFEGAGISIPFPMRTLEFAAGNPATIEFREVGESGASR